jgi:hypothetical protein
MSKTDIVDESTFWEQQSALLKRIKIQRQPRKVVKTETDVMRLGFKDIQNATINCELVIDKVCILTYPLSDPRTPEHLRALYLAQEDLMMQPEDVIEEQLSSPAREQKSEDLSCISTLKTLSDEQVTLFKKVNWEYLHKIFPELA